MIVYKCVRKMGIGLYKSAVINYFKGGLIYSIGKTTKPRIGKIYAFKQLEQASSFALSRYLHLEEDLDILECNCDNISNISEPRVMHTGCIDKKAIRNFWGDGGGRLSKWLQTGYAPTGTVLCEDITPLRNIYD